MPVAAERDALTREAVAQLSAVPLACNLDQLAAQLAYLRCYEVRGGEEGWGKRS